MDGKPKILVASPTYEGMKYCEKEFAESVTNLNYPNYDILIVDNSEKADYFNHLKETYSNFNIINDNPNANEKNKMLRLVHSRNLILDYAARNNYDYILMLDSDVIAPKNIIQELLLCDKDIVSGVYYNYFIVDGKTKYMPVAWTALTEKEFETIKQKIQLPDFISSSKDLRAHLTEEEVNSNKLIEVIIPSAGCMLISRNAFEKLRYGVLDTIEQGGVKTTDDIYFSLEARKQGFKAYCNTKIKCKHLIRGKFKKEGNLYKHPIYD
ncbi:MAG: glycosyltransferase [Candidatus Nanoarchaeia archaeon]|nr:glycosyltransferase [Candidatus Nanoarchaeia archaeon]MDD5740889.1 glycosyltransferase [Candidatus Nanoarchaeia archaeon]